MRQARFLWKVALCAVVTGVVLLGAGNNAANIGFAQPYGQTLDYASFYQQGNQLYSQGRMTEALEAYEKARPLAQGDSIPIVYNNIAAIYMKRGNYYLTNERAIGKALADFRHAVFYLDIGWPTGVAYSDNQKTNKGIAENNLKEAYRQGRLAQTPSAHLEAATDLRRQGRFREAATEYSLALDASNPTQSQQADSLRALGDIFLVLNRPHVAKKHYRRLLMVLPTPDNDVVMRLANAEYQSGEVDAAIERLSELTDNEPNNAAALRQLEQLWRTELRYNPNDPLVHANLGSIFQKQQLFDKALRAYTNAEKLALQTPGFDRKAAYELRLNAGTLHQAMGDNRLAEQAFTSVLNDAPTHARALELLAGFYQDTGQPRQAQETLARLVAAHPDNPEAHQRLLGFMRQQGDSRQRVIDLSNYGRRYSTNFVVQQSVAEALHAEGQPAESLPFYQQAVGLVGRSASVTPQQKAALFANYATALQATNQPAAALDYLQQAQRLDPTNTTVSKLAEATKQSLWQTSYAQAVAAQQNQQLKEALRLYEQTLQQARHADVNVPGDVYANYGLALQNNAQLPEAIAQYNNAIATNNTNGSVEGDWLFYRATAYHQQNKMKEAVADYRAALATTNLSQSSRNQASEGLALIEENQVHTLLEEALAAYNRKAYPQAISILAKAEQQDANNAFVAYYQGLVFDEQGKTNDAIAAYTKAVNRNADFADAYYGLAVAHDTAGHQADALSAYKKYLSTTSDSATATAKYAKTRVDELSTPAKRNTTALPVGSSGVTSG